MRTRFLRISAALLILIAIGGMVWSPAWWFFLILGPIVACGIYDTLQTRHAILRNFPVIGHFRYLLEGIGPELHPDPPHRSDLRLFPRQAGAPGPSLRH